MVSCTGITRQSCSFEVFISRASEQDLQIAADLAALFSKAKRNIKVPINLVKIKDLQKIKKEDRVAFPLKMEKLFGEILQEEKITLKKILKQ